MPSDAQAVETHLLRAETLSPSLPDASRTLRRITWQLALFLLFNIFVLNVAPAFLSANGIGDTALSHSRDVLRGIGGDDSWGPMAAAQEHIREGEAAPLYEGIFFEQTIKFQYPPSALFALEFMQLFGDDWVRVADEMTFGGLPAVNEIVGWIFLLLIAVSSAAILEIVLRRRFSAAYNFDAAAIIRVAAVFAFTLTFYPAIKAFTLGQIQLWINALFAAVLLLFLLGFRSASGVLTGLICLIKPHYGLLALWGLFNREWRFAMALMLTGSAGLVFALVQYGWDNHLDYLHVLSFMSERGESYHANQSINGVLNRIAGLGAPELYANVTFDAYGFPPYTPWVYWLTVLSSAAILLAVFLRRSGDAGRSLLFALVAISLTLASPIAWEHHYGLFLPVFALAAGLFAGQSVWLAGVAVSYALTSNYFPVFNNYADSVFNVVQSYTLAGGLFLLILLHLYHTRTCRPLDRSHEP